MAKWYSDSGMQSDIVLSTAVRYARNIHGMPFPNAMKDGDAEKTVAAVRGALADMHYGFSETDIKQLSFRDRQVLVEKRTITPDFAKVKRPASVFASDDGSVSIMVNGEDHIRMQAMFAGMEREKAYDIISKIDAYLAEKLDYAVHKKYGYLTASPSNVGTGMRVTYVMHLPAVVASGAAQSLFEAAAKLGVAVRPLYGENSKPSGNLFKISNQVTLGMTEADIMSNLDKVASGIIAKEKELRTKLLKERGIALYDTIMRSRGILGTARVMSFDEMMSLLSNVRLGVFAGVIKDMDSKLINTIMTETSPAHLSGDKATDSAERDIERARVIREKLKEE